MAIGTFSELKTSIGNWLQRSDLSSVIPDFITMAEAQLRRDSRLLVAGLEAVDETLSVSDELTSLPAGMLALSSIFRADGELIYMPSAEQRARYTEPGTPASYAIQGGKLRLYPSPDATYDLSISYYSLPSLSNAEPTNWLLENHPGIYLHAALLQAEPYLKNDERITVWAQMLENGLKNLARADQNYKFGGTLVMRVA